MSTTGQGSREGFSLNEFVVVVSVCDLENFAWKSSARCLELDTVSKLDGEVCTEGKVSLVSTSP